MVKRLRVEPMFCDVAGGGRWHCECKREGMRVWHWLLHVFLHARPSRAMKISNADRNSVQVANKIQSVNKGNFDMMEDNHTVVSVERPATHGS